MYWLTNPEHGVMPVYDLAEVERHKQWGWSLLNEGPSPLAKPARIEPVPAEEPETAPARKKPGRKPKVK
jgi:hypothetical protein